MSGRAKHLTVVAAYTLLGVWVTWRLWADPRHRIPPGHEPDPDLLKWFIAYAARVVTHLDNPFFTTMTGFPDGVNLLSNVSMLGLGIPFIPVTLLFGTDVSFLAMTTIGLTAGAAGWYLVFHRLAGRSVVASALAGGLCGVAPSVVAHALGHLHLSAAFVIPFIVFFALRLAEPGRQLRHGVYLGLLITWQVFIGAELLFLCALGLGAFVVFWSLAHPREARERAAGLLRGLAVAAVVAVGLLAYPLYFWFFGPQSYHGLDSSVQSFGADLGSFVRLPTQTLFGDRAGNAAFAQNYAEENTFYGWPMAVCATLCVVLLRKVKLVWVLSAVAVTFAVLSLGAVVTYRGYEKGPGPWKLLASLPLFDSVIPSRLGMVIVPCLALLLALAIDRLRELPRGWRYGGLAAIALALVSVFPTALPSGPQSAVPRFIEAGSWKPYVASGQTLVPVPLPSPDYPDSLRWAAETTIAFAMPNGYFLRPQGNVRGASGTFQAPERYTSDLLAKIERGADLPTITEANRREAAEDVRFWNAAAFVLVKDRHRAAQLKQALTELYGPPTEVDDVWVWDVRNLLGAGS